MQVTREDFNNYLRVQNSGAINMFDIKTVGELSGLGKETILEIMKNYSKLKTAFINGKGGD